MSRFSASGLIARNREAWAGRQQRRDLTRRSRRSARVQAANGRYPAELPGRVPATGLDLRGAGRPGERPAQLGSVAPPPLLRAGRVYAAIVAPRDRPGSPPQHARFAAAAGIGGTACCAWSRLRSLLWQKIAARRTAGAIGRAQRTMTANCTVTALPHAAADIPEATALD